MKKYSGAANTFVKGTKRGIFDPTDALATQEAAAKSLSWLLAAVASISLAVGGVSIMNTMLVSVTERTREIGLRRAVGARRRDVRNQFLVEAVLLAELGALAGTVLGVLKAAAIPRYGGWPVLISPGVVLLACSCTGLVGVVFGSLPAIRASWWPCGPNTPSEMVKEEFLAEYGLSQNQLAKAIGMSPNPIAEDMTKSQSWPIAWNRIDLIFRRQDRALAGNRNAG